MLANPTYTVCSFSASFALSLSAASLRSIASRPLCFEEDGDDGPVVVVTSLLLLLLPFPYSQAPTALLSPRSDEWTCRRKRANGRRRLWRSSRSSLALGAATIGGSCCCWR